MTSLHNAARRLADLREAMQAQTVDRRRFMQIAGAAAVATGLHRESAVGAAPGHRQVPSIRAQADANLLIYGSGQDISNLDPHTGHDYSITWGQRAVYDSLLRYQGHPAEIKPLLAKEVTGNDNATEWTIALDERATFHDGSAVDAEAVKYNFGRMLRKNLGVAWMFASIMDEESVAVVDPQTLKITLPNPSPRSRPCCRGCSSPTPRSSRPTRSMATKARPG